MWIAGNVDRITFVGGGHGADGTVIVSYRLIGENSSRRKEQVMSAAESTTGIWQEEVRRLARDRDAVLLAHNYQDPAIQDEIGRASCRERVSLRAGGVRTRRRRPQASEGALLCCARTARHRW